MLRDQKNVLELKIKHGESQREKGAGQLSDNMEKTGAEGYLILFDRDARRSCEQNISHEILDEGGACLEYVVSFMSARLTAQQCLLSDSLIALAIKDDHRGQFNAKYLELLAVAGKKHVGILTKN